MKLLNFTVHEGTQEQFDQGLNDHISFEDSTKEILNFICVPTVEEMKDRAKELVELMFLAQEIEQEKEYDGVMIGSGPPAFTYFLAKQMKKDGIVPYFSHSKRVCIEEHVGDGTVTKKYIFKHEGFYSI